MCLHCHLWENKIDHVKELLILLLKHSILVSQIVVAINALLVPYKLLASHVHHAGNSC